MGSDGSEGSGSGGEDLSEDSLSDEEEEETPRSKLPATSSSKNNRKRQTTPSSKNASKKTRVHWYKERSPSLSPHTHTHWRKQLIGLIVNRIVRNWCVVVVNTEWKYKIIDCNISRLCFILLINPPPPLSRHLCPKRPLINLDHFRYHDTLCYVMLYYYCMYTDILSL